MSEYRPALLMQEAEQTLKSMGATYANIFVDSTKKSLLSGYAELGYRRFPGAYLSLNKIL